MKRHGRTLKAYYYVKEDDLKTPHAMILTIWCSAKGDSKKTSSCQGGRGEEGWIWQAQRIVEQWKYSAILQWWICIIIHLSKPTEDTAPRGNQGVHFRRGAVTVCQCGSTPGERCYTWFKHSIPLQLYILSFFLPWLFHSIALQLGWLLSIALVLHNLFELRNHALSGISSFFP